MLADYLRRTGVALEVVRNNVDLEDLKDKRYSGLVLSPGPGRPEDAGNLLSILDYFHDKLPVLGVCLGHQAIGHYFGAQLREGNKPMHGKVRFVTQVSLPKVFQHIPNRFQVTRYHSLVLDKLPDCLKLTLEGPEGEVMGIKHLTLPIMGIQFHPEAHLTEYGEQMIAHWVSTFTETFEKAILLD